MAPKLLVVDDEPEVLKLLKTMLESFGCEVLATADSQGAAQRANREKFDAIFVDAWMPILDGFALTEQIRKSPSNSRVPIVMLTGSDDAQTMSRGFKSGVTFFLGKPFDTKKLFGLFKALRGTMLKEKRHRARVPLRTVVTCTVGKKHFRAGSLNIGEGGILLESSGGLEVGQIVDVLFTLPSIPQPLNPRAKAVRRESRDRIALRFVEFKPEQQKMLQDFIAELVKL